VTARGGGGGAPMRIALLGCGYAARLHGKTLRRLGADVRCSYASRDGARAAEYARRAGGAGHFASYEAAIASDDIDVVAVLVPPAGHLDWTLRALRAGKDVILEKPPLLRAADFDAIERAQADTGRRVFVAENYHYKPLAVALRRLLADRVVGDVLFVQLNAIKQQRSTGWRDDAALAGGGALYEGGIHWVSLLGSLGLTVRRVGGLRPGGAAALDRSMLVTFEYEEGAVGTLAYSWEVPSTLRGVRLSKIYGRGGSILFETNGLFAVVNGTRRRLLFPGLRDLQGYRAMFRDFVRAWRTGDEPQMTLARARRDLELVEAAYAAAGVTAAVPPAHAEPSPAGAGAPAAGPTRRTWTAL
jgi:predicted dehydrogenase